MRVWKRVLACALTAALIVPSISAAAEEPAGGSETVSEIGSENVPESGTEDQKEESGTPAGEEGDVAEGEEGKEESGTPAEGEGDVTGGEEDKEESGTPAGEEGDVTEGEEDKEESGTPAGEEEDVTEGEEDKEESQAPAEENGSNGLEDKEPVDEEEKQEVDEVQFNTGNHVWSVVNEEAFESGTGDVAFEDDGSYTINLEDNAFFPYEVQFTHDGEVTNEWFMTPDDSVEVGGHTFYVSSYADGTVLTQMTLKVGGDIIVVYPEEKEFTDEETGGIAPMSMLPLESKSLSTVDLSGYTPIELTMVEMNAVVGGADGVSDSTKIAWKRANSSEDNYILSGVNDKVDLSYGCAYGNTVSWEMIIGDGDQLNPDNVRYTIPIKTSSMEEWLIPSAYAEDASGKRESIVEDISYGEYYSRYSIDNAQGEIFSRNLTFYTSESQARGKDVYLGFELKPENYADSKLSEIKIVEGWHGSAESAVSALPTGDKTKEWFAPDMTQPQAGYKMENFLSSSLAWTLIAYDSAGNIIGFMPFDVWASTYGDYVTVKLYEKSGTGYRGVGSSQSVSSHGNFYSIAEFQLDKEYALNGNYSLVLDYTKSKDENPDITAVYVGRYTSISQAEADGAKDIKASVLGEIAQAGGYTADFSQGIFFTVFAGKDGDANQKIYQFRAITTRAELQSGTSITFTELYDADGKEIPSYVINSSDDSYAERNYITILVGEDVDLTKQYAPAFNVAANATVYTEGNSVPEVSGKTLHSFADGAVQYSVSAENGVNSKNYWVQVKKADSGNGQLYISSLEDPDANTRVENGVTYSTREVMLDGYHDYIHDICLVNIGTGDLPALSVELSSDVVELDPYWTLTGQQALKGMNTVEEPGAGQKGELPNLAKLRLRAKADVENGTEVSGTLTIKSDGKTLMVLTLTGMVGDPQITTTQIPEAVKYVPYGTMIQNSNKYSWINVEYVLTSGELPTGVQLKTNGELYGVPQETGTFEFTVKAIFSSNREAYNFPDSSVTLKLVVKENTNANVYNASDAGDGYSLETPIGIEVTPGSYDFYLAEIADTLFVSEGLYNEFIDLWLNGEKLVKGVDYTAESGSTRITISAQTLQNKALQSGANTIAAEFRVDGDMSKELRRTAQNFRLDGAGTDSGSSSSGSSGSGSSGSSDAVRGVTLSGYLVDANNAPMAGMTVELHSTPRTTVTDKNGYFRFADVEFGWHTLFVKDANGNLLASRRFELREDTVVTLSGDTVTAPAGSGISLTVRVADGELAFSNVRLVAAPRTGDESNLEIWLFVLALVCVALAGTVIYRRKTRHTV